MYSQGIRPEFTTQEKRIHLAAPGKRQTAMDSDTLTVIFSVQGILGGKI
jgi:hypothetical protein